MLIWPWKKISEAVVIGGKEKVLKYEIFFPTELSNENIIASLMIVLGILCVYILEKYSEK